MCCSPMARAAVPPARMRELLERLVELDRVAKARPFLEHDF